MPKYYINGKIFDTNDPATTQLCSFKKERIPGVYDLIKIYVYNDFSFRKRTFYKEVVDPENSMPIYSQELPPKTAYDYCVEYHAKETLNKGISIIINGADYETLTGFTN